MQAGHFWAYFWAYHTAIFNIMPKRTSELTIVEIKAKIKAAKAVTLYDGKGLELQITDRGNRWRLRYYRPDGRRNMIGLGTYPDLSLADARTEASKARTKVTNGLDPAVESKQDAKQQAARTSVREAADAWYKDRQDSWAPDTARKARMVLDTYLLPEFGSIPIKDLTTAQVKPVLKKLSLQVPHLATKARQYCNQFVTHAIQAGLREDGRELSLRGALKKIEKAHYPAVTAVQEMPALIKAIRGIRSYQSRTALLLCLYTAVRPAIAAGMRWDEVHLNEHEWHIPAERMKGKTAAHITPLPTQLIPLLQDLKLRTDPSPFVFPGMISPLTKPMCRDTLSKALRDNGLRGVTVTHGFRATLRTLVRERLRVPDDVLESQISHAKKGETQNAYDRATHLEERHEVVQLWADYLDQLETGEIPPLRKEGSVC